MSDPDAPDFAAFFQNPSEGIPISMPEADELTLKSGEIAPLVSALATARVNLEAARVSLTPSAEEVARCAMAMREVEQRMGEKINALVEDEMEAQRKETR